MRYLISTSLVVLALLAVGLNGCKNEKKGAADSGAPAAKGDHGHDHDGDHAHSDADMKEIEAELAKLSPEDAASAKKQRVCPVSGEMLGEMGPPFKVDVKGQSVWLCCDGCEEDLLADPDKYLAKLNQQ